MPRAHFTKAVIRRVSGAPAEGTVQVLQVGTNTPVTGKLFKADSGVDEYANPFTFTNGVVDFYMDSAQRVKLVVTPSGAAAQTFEDQDVEPPAEGQRLADNKPAADSLHTYPVGLSSHIVSQSPAVGYPAHFGADAFGHVETYRASIATGTAGKGEQRYYGTSTTGASATRHYARVWSDTGQEWGPWREVAIGGSAPTFFDVVARDAANPTHGYVSMVRGGAGRGGYAAFWKGDGTRIGYIGYGPFASEASDQGTILYVGARHAVYGVQRVERGVRAGVLGPDGASTSTGVDLLIDMLMS